MVYDLPGAHHSSLRIVRSFPPRAALTRICELARDRGRYAETCRSSGPLSGDRPAGWITPAAASKLTTRKPAHSPGRKQRGHPAGFPASRQRARRRRAPAPERCWRRHTGVACLSGARSVANTGRGRRRRRVNRTNDWDSRECTTQTYDGAWPFFFELRSIAVLSGGLPADSDTVAKYAPIAPRCTSAVRTLDSRWVR